MSVTVSVVIPCYQAERFIAETLESVLAQTCVPQEVLVINDGSTDQSSQIARSFGGIVRVIDQENQGESVARNRGITEATGSWVAFVDADDLWKPTKIERQIEQIDDGVNAVHTGMYSFGRKNIQRDVGSVPAETRYSLRNICCGAPIHVSSLMVRRSVCPRFPDWTKYSEDLIFFLELALIGGFRMVAEPLVGYRRHDANQSDSNPAMETIRHQVVERWISENNDRLTAAGIAEIRDAMIERLVRDARKAKRDRQWQRYWIDRKYLKQFEQNEAARNVTRQFVAPAWVYSIKDALTGGS